MIIRGRTPKPLSSGIGHDQWCQLARPPPGSRLLARETKTSWPRAAGWAKSLGSKPGSPVESKQLEFESLLLVLRCGLVPPKTRPAASARTRADASPTRVAPPSGEWAGAAARLAIRFHRGCVCPGPRAPPWAQPRRRRGAAGRGVAGRSAVGPSPARLCCPKGPVAGRAGHGLQCTRSTVRLSSAWPCPKWWQPGAPR